MKIRFTGFGTVLLDDKEMDEKVFWERLEDNIDDHEYGVMYDEKKSKFTVYFNDYTYNVELTDKELEDLKNGVYSPLVRKLIMLSRVQKVIDITNGDSNLTESDILDKDTRNYYLSKLRKDNKFTKEDIRRYFKNLWEDVKESWGDATYFVGDIDEEIKGIIRFFGGVISIILAATIGGIPTEEGKELIEVLDYILFIIGGLATPLLAYPISFLIYNTRHRFERLVENIKTKKLNNVKIKSLESVILEEERKITDQVPLLPSNDKAEDFNKLSEIIDNLLDSLKEVEPAFRGDLTEKVRDCIERYKYISGNNRKDMEILTLYPNFIDDLNELEIEITNAKRLSKEHNREREILYLEDKLEKIEEEDKGYSYKKIPRK